MEVVQKLFKDARIPFVSTVAATVALFSVLFLSFVSVSTPKEFREYLNMNFSFKYSDISDWNWLVVLVLVSIFALSGYVLYQAYLGSTNKRMSMMSSLLGVIGGGLVLVILTFDVILQDRSGSSLDFGFFVFVVSLLAIVGINFTAVSKDKGYAKEVMGQVKSTVESKAKAVSEQAKESADSAKEEVKN